MSGKIYSYTEIRQQFRKQYASMNSVTLKKIHSEKYASMNRVTLKKIHSQKIEIPRTHIVISTDRLVYLGNC